MSNSVEEGRQYLFYKDKASGDLDVEKTIENAENELSVFDTNANGLVECNEFTDMFPYYPYGTMPDVNGDNVISGSEYIAMQYIKDDLNKDKDKNKNGFLSHEEIFRWYPYSSEMNEFNKLQVNSIIEGLGLPDEEYNKVSDLFGKKTKLTRKDVIEMANDKGLNDDQERQAKILMQVFDVLADDNDTLDISQIKGKSLCELKAITIESEKEFQKKSNEEKMKIAAEDARKFLEAAGEKELLDGLDIVDKIYATDDLPEKEIEVEKDGKKVKEKEKADGQFFYNTDTLTIPIHEIKIDADRLEDRGDNDKKDEYTRTELTSVLLHEIVHSRSYMYRGNSKQEEFDANSFEENYLDLYGEGDYAEEEEYVKIKEHINNSPFYKGLEEYGGMHRNPVEFQSSFDLEKENTGDMDGKKASQVLIDNFDSIVSEQKLLGLIPNPWKNEEKSSWDTLMKAYNNTDDKEFKSAIEWWCKHKDAFDKMEGLSDNGKTDGNFLLEELKKYKETL